MALNPKRRRFVAEYLKDQNGTQAAMRAGYSKKTANEQASQLLANLSVRAEIDKAQTKVQDKAELTQERILKVLLAVAELDPRKLFNADGTMKPVNELSDETAMAIASIESDDGAGELKKVKFADKIRAVELLGKHLRMFTDLHELSGKRGAPLQVRNIDLSGVDEKTLLKIAGMGDAAA